MTFILSFLLGFATAFIGISPPGLINMTAVKINLKEGKRTALWFVLGAVLVIFFQTTVAIFFARVIDGKPALILLLREIGCVVFAFLTVYFLWIAKKPKRKKGKIKKYSKSSRFFLGMLLSTLNLFPIPYYVLVSITLASYSLFSFDLFSILIFVSGVVTGSFLVFYCYVSFFERIESKADYIVRNMNTIIGSITGIITLITLWNISTYYLG
ncbi:LysE family transporter [Flavobacterium restrictum]|uniref:Lysine transporter LysE n=1 Tax=Flavobacterium restrictum TaxID=2594428 RepID=A0A553DV75_9FLAO|nr:LysE family transporter [Flavobacterium restrictum]TRX36662.1 lysine transporter LysE [Flavobacterium restrictum]